MQSMDDTSANLEAYNQNEAVRRLNSGKTTSRFLLELVRKQRLPFPPLADKIASDKLAAARAKLEIAQKNTKLRADIKAAVKAVFDEVEAEQKRQKALNILSRAGKDNPPEPGDELPPDEEIDTSDIPEVRDWSGAKRGRFYRPNKASPLGNAFNTMHAQFAAGRLDARFEPNGCIE